MTRNEELQHEYTATLNRIREQLQRLEQTIANEPVIAPNWACVGTLYEVRSRLQDMNEWLNNEGEYANPQPLDNNRRLEV